MMGSAGDLPSVPQEKTKFIEDMTESEATAAVSSFLSRTIRKKYQGADRMVKNY